MLLYNFIQPPGSDAIYTACFLSGLIMKVVTQFTCWHSESVIIADHKAMLYATCHCTYTRKTRKGL